MELIYLWVEDYKNIHRQGFNFSPRFECKFYDKYDEDGNLENNCELLICDKEEDECLDKETKKCKPCQDNGYIKDFFGDNINVTAIVGKNGSGKSTLLEILLKIQKDNKNFPININYIFIFKESDNFYIKKTIIFKKISSISLSEHQAFSLIDLAFFNLSNLKNTQGYTTPIVLNNHYLKNARFRSKIMNIENPILNKLNFITLLFLTYNNNYKNIFFPKRIEIKCYFKKYIKFNIERNINIKSDLEKMEEQLQNINTSSDYNFLEEYINILVKIESITAPLSMPNKDGMLDLLKQIQNNKDKVTLKIQKNKIDDTDITISLEFKMLPAPLEVKDFLEHFLSFVYHNEFDIIGERNNERISFNSLSEGEKALIYYSSIFIYLQNNSINLFIFDEAFNTFHPSWQQKIIKNYIEIFRQTKYPIHLIFTTHSPFLLSDIPKQNIIFLDTYKEEDEEVKNGKQKVGKCKVVDGLNKKKETFGANIHTLLSDSFFMEDGLMGEFAKGKINKIIRFLNGDNKFIDFPINQIKKVIESIGEPFLKQKLLDMYDKKFIKEYKDRQKEKIKKQIEDLNNQLKELDND